MGRQHRRLQYALNHPHNQEGNMDADEFVASFSDEDIAKQETLAQHGAELQEMCKLPAWTRLHEKITARVKDEKNKWLDAKDSNTAEVIRVKAQVWKEVLKFVESDLKKGLAAKEILARHATIFKSENPTKG